MLFVNEHISIPISEFEFSFSSSPGPGGQNVNKVATKAHLKWPVTTTSSLPAAVRQRFLAKYGNRVNKLGDLVVVSHRFRDQSRNVADCLSKLREMILAVATAPKQRRPTRPSTGSVRRRLENKQRVSAKKQIRRGKFDSD